MVRVPAERREQFQESLKAAVIDSGIRYPIALSNLIAISVCGIQGRTSRTRTRCQVRSSRGQCFPELEDEQIQYVVEKARCAVLGLCRLA